MGKVLTGALVLLASLLACGVCAFALDPSLDVSQYAHTPWKITEGFAKGTIHVVGQTPDGYLWLATESGLLRFDGARTVEWQPLAGEHLPSRDIRSLIAAHDGTLWIGTAKGLVSWKAGKLIHYRSLTNTMFTRCCRIAKEPYGQPERCGNLPRPLAAGLPGR